MEQINLGTIPNNVAIVNEDEEYSPYPAKRPSRLPPSRPIPSSVSEGHPSWSSTPGVYEIQNSVHRRKKASSDAYCRISHELMNAPGGVAVSCAQIKLMAPLEVGQPMFRMKNLRSGEHRIVEVQQTKLTCRPPPASRPV